MDKLLEGWRKYLGLGKEAEPEEEVPEPEEEEEEEQVSMEAKIAMLLMKEEENQATMMFDMLSDELDLDLLATEIDDGLRAEWEALPPETKLHGLGRVPTPEELAQALKYSDAWRAWIPKLGAAVRFVTGGDKTQGFRPTASVYKLGSLKDTLARHLRKTAHAIKNPSEDTSDEDLMENWRQYMKDNPHLDDDEISKLAPDNDYYWSQCRRMEAPTHRNNRKSTLIDEVGAQIRAGNFPSILAPVALASK